MNLHLNIYSILSFATFLLFAELSIYILVQNAKSNLNKTFFIACLSYMIWSFSQIFFFAEQNNEWLIIWDKISSIGWCTFPAFTLAFFVILTETENKLLRKVIIPISIAIGFIFVIKNFHSGLLAKEIIVVNKVPFYILNEKSVWLWCFYIYILIASFLGLAILWRWKIKNNNEKKQFRIIFYTMLVFIFLSYASDILLPVLYYRQIPGISNIFSIIWVLGISVAILKYRFLSLSPTLAAEEIISKINEIIFFVGMDEKILLTNQRTQNIVGLSELEIATQPLKNFFNQQDYEKIKGLINLQQPKNSNESVEVELITQNKINIPIELTVSIFKSKSETIIGYVLIAHDLRQTKQLKNEIDEKILIQDKLKSTLNQLENRVEERTAALTELNDELLLEIKEREKIANALKESEDRYKALFDRNPLAIIVYNEETLGFLEINNFAINHYGYTKEEFLNLKITDVLIQKDSEIVKKITNKKPLPDNLLGNYKCIKKDGAIIDIETISHSLNFNNQKARIVLANDITERIKAEKRLQESEERYRFLIEQQGEGLGITDLEENFLFSNLAAENIFGVAKGSLVGRNLKEFITEEELKNIKKQTAIRKNGNTTTYELEIIRPDKENRKLIITATPQYDKNNNIISTLGIFRDITELKKVEDQLRESESRLLEAQKIAKIASWEMKVRTKAVTHSENFYKILGIYESNSKTEFNNMLYQEMMYSNGLNNDDDKVDITQVNKQSAIPSSIKDKKGRIKYINSFKEVEYDKNGEPSKFIITIQDVTEQQNNEDLKRNIEVTKRSAELKQQFLANMSHEIRTPLNAIIGYTNLLYRTTELSEKQKSYLDNIKNSSNNLLVVINDILDLTKMNAGKLTLENIDFSIKEIIHNVVSILNVKASEQQISLNYDIDQTLPEVLIGDPVRLNQILINLIGNAIKFVEKNGKVEIITQVLNIVNNKYSIVFKIKDNGIGIPKEKIDTIFESFTQAESDTTRRFGGTGLGLAIVKELVELMKGEISVESEIGLGTTFLVKIDFEKGVSENLPKPQNEKVILLGNQHPDKINVLLVEDNEINRHLAIETLNTWNERVIIDSATNGKIAFEKASKNNYHIILMDIQMPEMDGYETTQLIRNTLPEPFNLVPIVAMSAHALREEKSKCIDIGMNGYVTKPFIPEELFKIIRLFSCFKNIELIKNGYAKQFKPFTCNDCELMCFQNDTDQTTNKNDEKKLTDIAYLSSMLQGNKEKIKKMISLYMESMPSDLIVLGGLIQQGLWKEVENKAHSLKPVMTYLGLEILRKKALEIEQLSREKKEVDKIKIIYESFLEIWKEAELELKMYTD